MDGPSHYREAEKWLTLAGKYVGLPNDDDVQAARIAHVHATLALAAAAAMAPGGPSWQEVAGA